MTHRIFYILFFAFFIIHAGAQRPGGGGGAASMQNGRFYGKIVDAKTNKPIVAASVQLVTTRRNTATVSSKDSIVNGQLTENNGDFSMENVGFFGNYRLLVTAIGYKTVERPVSFFTPEQQQKLAAAMGGMGIRNTGAAMGSGVTDTSLRGMNVYRVRPARDTTMKMIRDSGTAMAMDTTAKLHKDSANLSTQKLTTIIDTSIVTPDSQLSTGVSTGTHTATQSFGDTTAVRPATDSAKMNRPPAANPGANPGSGRSRTGGMAGGNMMEAIRQVFGNNFSQIMSQADKDLGNIKLEQDAAALGNVTVTASQPVYTLGIDRKIFNVDRALTSQGQTAVEVLRQVPAVNVDIDGNVTLRNSAPTLFVDGRPTTLTLDQIPADAIQSIEVITNPSAKFDASGGTASILNIVMKKNRKNGYNGSLRAGVDSRGRFNGGGDFNIRQKKINTFISGQYGQRKSKSSSDINTDYFTIGNRPAYHLLQTTPEGINKGGFGFVRGGFDYFMDNRNTLTVSGNYTKGSFDNSSNTQLFYDTLYANPKTGRGERNSSGTGSFRNYGGSVSYKHNFAKTGHELTADVNLNSSKSNNYAIIGNSIYNERNQLKNAASSQITNGGSNSTYWVVQSDYANPISENAKIEGGIRAQIRDFSSTNRNDTLNNLLGKYVTNSLINSNYKFTDQVYAAYITYTGKKGNLGYNIGLRAENSNYDGRQIRTGGDSLFKVSFPISFFPSAFLSYKLSEKQDLQFNYTRRINRPNFFQLLPFTDYSDQQNLSRGNPNLTPEFTNSLEANYSWQLSTGNSILVSAYYKSTDNLITRFLDTAYNTNINQYVSRSTYINANNSKSYGLELTSRNNITRAWDITTNLNFYNASISAGNGKTDSAATTNSRFSYFGKINTNYKLGKNSSWTIQANADYQGKTVLPVGGGGGRGGGGGGFFGGGNQPAGNNGYVNSNFGLDLAIKKEFLKNKAASITLSMNDVFRTRKRDTYIESGFYTQQSINRRDAQILRLQFNWRFGRQDINLFKRKNMRSEEGGNDLNQGN